MTPPSASVSIPLDKGVEDYLNSPVANDYNVAAAQLKFANAHLMVDAAGKLLPLSKLEARFQAYEQATWYYGFLNLAGVQSALRKFWGFYAQ